MIFAYDVEKTCHENIGYNFHKRKLPVATNVNCRVLRSLPCFASCIPTVHDFFAISTHSKGLHIQTVIGFL